MIEVDLPDGSVAEFPDGTDQGTIKAALQKRFPTERPEANYGNEGRRSAPAAAQKTVSPTRRLLRSVLPEGAADAAADLAAGVGKAGVDTATSVLNAHPAYKLIRAAGMTQGKDIDKPQAEARRYAKEQYDEAGPIAGLAKFGTDMAIAGPATGAVTEATLGALRGASPIVRGALAGATGGFTGGALPGPGDDESRLQNAMQGAAGGLALGGLSGAAAPAFKYLSELRPTPGSSAERAVRALTKSLGGKGQMESVTSNLDNPRMLPMTTAGASGSPGLAQIESQARQRITPRTRGRWENVDRQTNEEAWRKFQEITGRATDLDTATSAQRAIVPGLHQKLDKTVVSQANRKALVQELEVLRDSPEFITNDASKMELNRLMANVMDPDFKLGSLAYYLERLPKVGNFTDTQKDTLGRVLHGTVNQLSKGQYSKAMDELATAGVAAERAGAANRVVNNFMGETGVVKGRSGNEIPRVTSERVKNAMNQQIAGKGTLEARGTLHPDDHYQLEELVKALQQAEHPRSVPAGKQLETGSIADALENVPSGSWTGRGIRTALRTLTGSRDDATAKAIEMALRSPRGWKAILDMNDKNISASDARELARILRRAQASGAAANED